MDIVALMSPEGRREELANPFGNTNSMVLEVGLGLTESFVYPSKRSSASGYKRKTIYKRAKKNLNKTKGKITVNNQSAVRSAISRPLNMSRSIAPLTRQQKYNIKENIAARNFFTSQFTAIGVSLAFSVASALTKPKINKIAVQRDNTIFYDESFMDTAAAYTQRQRALQAVMDNQMNVQHIIGNEAAHMHR
jgi:hypothetical protein